MKLNRLADRISRMGVSDTEHSPRSCTNERDESSQADEIIIIEDDKPVIQEDLEGTIISRKEEFEHEKYSLKSKREREKQSIRSLRDPNRSLSIFKTGSVPYRVIRKITGVFGFFHVIFKKLHSYCTVERTAAFLFVFLILIIGVNRLPSFIYNLRQHVHTTPEYHFVINEKYANAINEALEEYSEEDFDGDGIMNSEDTAPYDIDEDNNGVIDSDLGEFEFSGNFRIGDVIYEPVSHESGITQLLDLYEINGCKDQWVKVPKRGYPYIYSENRWMEAEYTEKEDNLYVLIPFDYCYLRILDKKAEKINALYLFNSEFRYSSDNIGGKLLNGLLTVFYPYKSDCPYDIGCRETIYVELSASDDIISSNRVTRVNEKNLYRFAKMPLNSDDLVKIYDALQLNKTRVLSLQSDNGEILVIVYGCDNMGNLYVADYTDPSNKRKLELSPKTTLVQSGEHYMIKTIVKINGFEDWKVVLVD